MKGHFEPSDAAEPDSLPVAPEDPQNLDVSDLMEERYSRLVREAYEQEIISIGRAGEMLNLSLYQMRTLVRAWQVPACILSNKKDGLVLPMTNASVASA